MRFAPPTILKENGREEQHNIDHVDLFVTSTMAFFNRNRSFSFGFIKVEIMAIPAVRKHIS